jgi:hypothetical protein
MCGWRLSIRAISMAGAQLSSGQRPNMPLQRTRSRALLGRSPLNGGSLDGLD